MIRASFLSWSPSFAVGALIVAAACFVATPGARAQADAASTVGEGPRVELRGDDRLELTRPMRRAQRSIRAGATLIGLGTAGVLAGGIVLARIDDRDCATDEPFCDNAWAKGMGALTGMVVGASVITSGVLTLSFGLARRNRLHRVDEVALAAAPDRLQLRLRF